MSPTSTQIRATAWSVVRSRRGRALHAPGQQVLVRRLAERAPEAAHEVPARHARRARDARSNGCERTSTVAGAQQVPADARRHAASTACASGCACAAPPCAEGSCRAGTRTPTPRSRDWCAANYTTRQRARASIAASGVRPSRAAPRTASRSTDSKRSGISTRTGRAKSNRSKCSSAARGRAGSIADTVDPQAAVDPDRDLGLARRRRRAAAGGRGASPSTPRRRAARRPPRRAGRRGAGARRAASARARSARAPAAAATTSSTPNGSQLPWRQRELCSRIQPRWPGSRRNVASGSETVCSTRPLARRVPWNAAAWRLEVERALVVALRRLGPEAEARRRGGGGRLDAAEGLARTHHDLHRQGPAGSGARPLASDRKPA